MRLLTPSLINSLINEESQRNAVDGRFSQLYGKSENRADVNSKLKDPVIGCNLISLQKEEKVIICVMGTKEECIIFLMIFLSPLTFLPFLWSSSFKRREISPGKSWGGQGTNKSSKKKLDRDSRETQEKAGKY